MEMSLEYVMLSEIHQYQTINTVTAYMTYLKENIDSWGGWRGNGELIYNKYSFHFAK